MTDESPPPPALATPEAAWRSASPPPTRFSIELFPPKTPAGLDALRAELVELRALDPAWASVTCGAGGSGGRATLDTIEAVGDALDAPFAAHVTAIDKSKREVEHIARKAWNAGVRRILALRGDSRPDSAPHPGRYRWASDLILGLRAVAPFEIAAACHPEGHPEAASLAADLDNLERKVEAGASRLIGQFCFDTDQILRFRDALAARGLEERFVPGVLPVRDIESVRRFARSCGAGAPDWLNAVFGGPAADRRVHRMVAAGLAADQCRRLAAEGLREIHLYCLNRSDLALAIARLTAAPHVAPSRVRGQDSAPSLEKSR